MKAIKINILILLCSLAFGISAQQTAEDYLKEGQDYYKNEQFNEAMDAFRKGLKLSPDSYELTKSVADSKHKLEKFEEAVKWYNKAEKLNEEDAQLYFDRAAALVFMEEYKKAIKDLKKSIEIDDQNPEVYYFMGYSNAALLPCYKNAIDNYNMAIKLKPDYAAAIYNRGAAKAELENYDAGIKDFEIALEKDPDLENGRINIALSKFGQKRYEEAIKDFDYVISQRDENLARAFYYRGEAYYEMNNREKACDDWQKSANLKNEQAEESISSFCGSKVKKRREIDIVF